MNKQTSEQTNNTNISGVYSSGSNALQRFDSYVHMHVASRICNEKQIIIMNL